MTIADALLPRAEAPSASRAATVRLLTLNISGPSVARAERLFEFLIRMDLDVAVLTETRANSGTALLLDCYRAAGYTVTSALPSPRERGVAVVRRIGAENVAPSPRVNLAHRLIVDELMLSTPATLLGAYVPSRDASQAKIRRKQTFLQQMNRVLRAAARTRSTILMGDFNIVGRGHVPRYSAFKAWEYDALEGIAAAGLVDVFAELNPGVQAHSWIGRTGSGYRYDYAFVSENLMDSVRCCEYLHEPREVGITDHAGVLLELSCTERASLPHEDAHTPRRPSIVSTVT